MAEVVVVGAGLAGARTCAVLRTAGVTGQVVLLGVEQDPPYDRPPLTKDPDAEVDLRTAMGLDVFGLADEVRLGVRAESLRVEPGAPGDLVVACSDGTDIHARAVVVATGADPIRPAGWTRPGVHVLHTRRDAGSFWGAVAPGVRLVVVGGGWVGCEAAATAAARGARVDLVEAGGRVLGGHVPPEVSARVAAWLAEAGVRVRTDHPVQGIEGADGSLAVAGIPADLVLVAMGVLPTTSWLVGSGIAAAPGGAVRVDPWGRSSRAGVFAVGDAAARWSPRLGSHLPGGHWTEALNAPETVATAVAEWLASASGADWWGSAPRQPAADALPYVFSDIGKRTLLVLGAPGTGHVVWREAGEAGDAGDAGEAGPSGPQAWSAFTLDASDRLLGLCTSGRPRDLAAARRAMRAHPTGTPRTDPDALADANAGPDAMFPGEG